MLQNLSGLTLTPIELLLDGCFTAIRNGLAASGPTILCMSVIVSLFFLPARIREQGKLSPVRILLPLLLLGCGFAASGRFFSSLNVIQGESFGLIRDLGKPDGLLGGVSLLPLVAGVLFLVAGQIRAGGASAVRRVLIAVLSILLVILTNNQPAAMGLFWLGNGAGYLAVRVAGRGRMPGKAWGREDRKSFFLLLFSCLYLGILTGLLIPSEILNASPGEFVDVHSFQNPDRYLLQSALTGLGLFVIWPLVYSTALSSRRLRIFAAVMAALMAVSAVNYMFFSQGFGIISSVLRYEVAISNPVGTVLLNLLCVAAVSAGVILAVRKKENIVRWVCLYGCIAITVMSVVNIVSLENKTGELKEISSRETREDPSFSLDRNGKNVVVIMLDRAISNFVPYILNEKPELLRQFDGFTWFPNTLSYGLHTNIAAPALYGGYDYTPDGLESRDALTLVEKHNEALQIMPKNFLNAGFEVTVCDAPLANYQWIPDLSIYQEDPEIRTFHTIGHFDEYKTESLEWEDHLRNRNLLCYSLFRAAPSLLQELLYDGGNYLESNGPEQDAHSLYGVSTDFLNSYMVMKNLGTMTDITADGRNTFLLLTNEMTHNVIELQEPEYVPARGVDNQAWDEAHPVRVTADGWELDLANAPELTRIHYHADMAAFLLLGSWFDELRQQGVYDNTRIILVSDHACYLGLSGITLGEGRTDWPEVWGSSPEQWTDTTCYNPLLMVKDFGATGFTVDNAFMTNADTPTLAFDQVVPEPMNPFTGREITAEMKNAEEQHLIESSWDMTTNNGLFFSDPVRIVFRGRDIFNPAGWILPE